MALAGMTAYEVGFTTIKESGQSLLLNPSAQKGSCCRSVRTSVERMLPMIRGNNKYIRAKLK